MTAVHRHYARVERETAPAPRFLSAQLPRPIVIVPVESWTSVTQKALRLALSISSEIQAVHVQVDGTEAFRTNWAEEVEKPARACGLPPPSLVVLPSPYRFVVHPILEYTLTVEREHPDRMVAVVIPELVERHWWHYFLHNQRGELLTALLLVKGDRRISVVNVPWYLIG
jgi:hypothetical protein